MLIGAHTVIYSANAEADRAFFRDALKLRGVDAGGGFVIYGLPPSEVSLHDSDKHLHELYLLCDDVKAFIADMQERGIACDDPKDQGWGLLTQLTLPGGGKLGVYQPRHARPSKAKKRKTASKPKKK